MDAIYFNPEGSQHREKVDRHVKSIVPSTISHHHARAPHHASNQGAHSMLPGFGAAAMPQHQFAFQAQVPIEGGQKHGWPTQPPTHPAHDTMQVHEEVTSCNAYPVGGFPQNPSQQQSQVPSHSTQMRGIDHLASPIQFRRSLFNPAPAQPAAAPATSTQPTNMWALGQRVKIVHTTEPDDVELLTRFKLGHYKCAPKNGVDDPQSKVAVPKPGGKVEQVWRCAKKECYYCGLTAQGQTDLTAAVAKAHHLAGVSVKQRYRDKTNTASSAQQATMAPHVTHTQLSTRTTSYAPLQSLPATATLARQDTTLSGTPTQAESVMNYGQRPKQLTDEEENRQLYYALHEYYTQLNKTGVASESAPASLLQMHGNGEPSETADGGVGHGTYAQHTAEHERSYLTPAPSSRRQSPDEDKAVVPEGSAARDPATDSMVDFESFDFE